MKDHPSSFQAEPALAIQPDLESAASAERIFHALAPGVYTLALRLTGHDSDAADVTRDVLVRAARRLDRLPDDSQMTGWLRRTTVNAALAARRRRPDRKAAPWSCVGTFADGLTPTQRLEEALAGLPWTHRDVFVLADIEGLAGREVGRLLGLTLPEVKRTLHEARLAVREALRP
jgi:RNA polymerase sigma-70 factor (ECF subfamily)